MGTARWLYDNKVTGESMFTVSSLKNGLVTKPLKTGTGSAEMIVTGVFTGEQNILYKIVIDGIGSGQEIGEATFEWFKDGVSQASGQVTVDGSSADPVFSIGNSLSIYWTTEAGNDFVLGDEWVITGYNNFNASKLIDLDRNTRWRSADVSGTKTIDMNLETAQAIKALIIYDHNFTSAATGSNLKIIGDSASTFNSDGGNPEFSENITWSENKILHYLSSEQTYKYWRLSITDTSNPDGYLEIGELYIGPYTALSKGVYRGTTNTINSILVGGRTKFGIRKSRFLNKGHNWKYLYKALSDADRKTLEGILNTIGIQSSGKLLPVYFNEDITDTDYFFLVEFDSMIEKFIGHQWWDISFALNEVLTSV